MTTVTPEVRARQVDAGMDLFRYVKECRKDPIEFIRYCLTDTRGHPLEMADVHRRLHLFLSKHPKALIELPRDHGKSTQVCGRILWELGRNPSLRVKLVCATDALAIERCRFLRSQIADNDLLRRVFPHLRPSTPWTAGAFTIQRPAEGIGPSVAAFGVGAGSTGTRADLLVCDDIVDVRSLHCPGERRRVRDYFHNNLLNLLEPDGRFWGLFTPWHRDDLNAHLKRNEQFPLFRRAVGVDFEPVWAEKWSRDQLMVRKAEIGEASFARGYRLETRSEDEVLIRPEWVQFWDEEFSRSAYETVVLAVDPAVSVKASADRSGLVVVGLVGAGCASGTGNTVTGWGSENPVTAFPVPGNPGNRIHILHTEAHRLLTPDLTDRIAAVNAQCQPDVILFESNAAFAGIKDMLTRDGRFGAKVLGRAATRHKDARVAALSVAIQNGCVRLKGRAGMVDAAQRELFEELTSYPFGTHDDLADATAAAVEQILHRPQPRVWI